MKANNFKIDFNAPHCKVLLCVFVLTIFSAGTAFAQATTVSGDIAISGIVSNEDGALPGVNVILKGTKTGTVTDLDGSFAFPVKLKVNDVLVFQYLGYVSQEVRIKQDTSFIKLELTPDLVEILGAPDVDKPYKSKRKQKQ